MPHCWIDDSRALYASPQGWSINPAPGWSVSEWVDEDGGERHPYVFLWTSTRDATLRFDTFDPSRCPADVWIEACEQMDRARSRNVVEVRFGCFTGYGSEFEAGEEWLRSWTLRVGDFPLGAIYRCPISHVGRDDAAVEWMLESLFFRRVPGV